jgi:hypothetical protein
VKTWAEFYTFGLQAMLARIRGLNVLALLIIVGTSKAVPLQMVLYEEYRKNKTKIGVSEQEDYLVLFVEEFLRRETLLQVSVEKICPMGAKYADPVLSSGPKDAGRSIRLRRQILRGRRFASLHRNIPRIFGNFMGLIFC